jgi:hypothetical protein
MASLSGHIGRLFAVLALLFAVTSSQGGTAASAPLDQDSRIYLPLLSRSQGPILDASIALGGFSLEEVARRTAAFNVTLDPALYPEGLPFTILNTGGDRRFVVAPGTYFYIPIGFVDDSPPIIGAFPADASGAQAYFFGPTQLGGHDFSITIDGVVHPLGPAYLAGPVTTDPLLDGGGTHYMAIAAFMAPLAVGAHEVTLQGEFSGDAVVALFGGVYPITITYTVIVE